MNIQELIKKYEEEYETVFGFTVIQLNQILEDLKQLDEPQKVTIPQFVADWIDNVKRNGLKQKNNFGFFEEITSDSSAYTVMYHIFKEGIATKNIRNWVSDNTDEFARAWLDGYEVEKEKRYLVKVKGVSGEARYLNREVDGDWYINNKQETHHFKVLHTRKELEQAGFSWVFDCPGVEVEEVE